MTSDTDDPDLGDYNLDADDPSKRDWTESLPKIVSAGVFISNLYLLYLLFSFIT